MSTLTNNRNLTEVVFPKSPKAAEWTVFAQYQVEVFEWDTGFRNVPQANFPMLRNKSAIEIANRNFQIAGTKALERSERGKSKLARWNEAEAVHVNREWRSLLASEGINGAKLIRLEYVTESGKVRKFNGRVTCEYVEQVVIKRGKKCRRRKPLLTVVSENGKRRSRSFWPNEIRYIRHSKNLGHDVVRLESENNAQ